ncbi:bifunctional serine/threonine-protein kinase/formylglycine-generating enzyme family protein [Myxococcota bacterium]|nr:bifunctional serine/threonine-protein kinase/formylglycine-generating enzyme family protein [Myxococcota bacterium]
MSGRSNSPPSDARALAALEVLLHELLPDGGAVSVGRLAQAIGPLLDRLADPQAGPDSTLDGPDPHATVLERLGSRAGRPAGVITPPPLLDADDVPPVQADADGDEVPDLGGRYRYRREIGRGGQGRILEALDRDIGRVVALKVVRDAAEAPPGLRRFVAEAQVTGQLEHPNIVPVHDLGRLPSGTLYYTMKRVEGRSLEQVIRALRREDPDTVQRFTLIRLLTTLQQVCQGVHFAHTRGVIHRDLKPANVMLGDYGEVLILDWGLARILSPTEPFGLASPYGGPSVPPTPGGTPAISPGSSGDTRDGFVQGTPPFMAPEQARNDRSRIGPWSDVYALGAILYQVLTHELTFQAPDPREVMLRTVDSDPPPPHVRAPHLQVPRELSDLAMRCLERDPDRRLRSAWEVEQAIEDFLEGRRRKAAAADRTAVGRVAAERYHAIRHEVDRLVDAHREGARSLVGHEPEALKAPVWEIEDRIEDARRRGAVAFLDAEGAFEQALAWDDGNREARAGLASLYWTRFRDAEADRSREDQLRFEALVRRYDDGTWAQRLRGDGEVSVESDPPGAQVWIYAYREQGRRLRPAEARLLGRTPLGPVPLAMGAWLMVLRREGALDTRYPLRLGRGESHRARIRLVPTGHLPDSLHHVPAGPFVMGGDPHAPGAAGRELVRVGDVAIARFPVTVGEYLEFLRSIGAGDPDRAYAHAPRRFAGSAPVWPLDRGGLFTLPEGEGPGGRLDPMRPASGIARASAGAYVEWLATRTGLPLRLPTEGEWEKAARGADGRWFPWGDRFDPTFCKMRRSRPGQPRPEAIGAFPADRSPYGVRDMAGGVREWCSGWLGDGESLCPVRGGSWQGAEDECRVAGRSGEPPDAVSLDLGVRVAMGL